MATWPKTYIIDPLPLSLDDDECVNSAHNCGENSSCTNTVGSFICQCNTGYEVGDGHEPSCDNTDECMTGAHVCDPNASCSDTDGSYACACNEGYVGNGTDAVF